MNQGNQVECHRGTLVREVQLTGLRRLKFYFDEKVGKGEIIHETCVASGEEGDVDFEVEWVTPEQAYKLMQ